jgi:hypothetical protein
MRHLKDRLVLLGLALGMVGLLLTSCDLSLYFQHDPAGKLGDLNLRVSSPEQSRSLLPDNPAIATYFISGRGPGGLAMPTVADSTDGSFAISGLVAGDWVVTVGGKNSAGQLIASGSVTVTIIADSSVSASLGLTPVSGLGLLNLSCTWPLDKSIDSVSGTLTATDATVVPITLDVNGSSASLKDFSLASGSYVLALNFKNNTKLAAASRTDTVLIYADSATSGSFNLFPEDFSMVSSLKAILTFGFTSPSATGTIDESNRTIAVSVPAATNVSSLVPTVTFDGDSISPAVGVMVDFTGPVVYTVTAMDGSTAQYTVTVTKSGAAGISASGPVLVTVALAGNRSSLAFGTSMTVTATPSVTVDSFAWYLDGAKIDGATGAVWTGGSSLGKGPHGLMAVVSKNGLLFSASCYFVVN